MNPPYGRQLTSWVAKAREEHLCGRAELGVVALVPARTDTRWWHDSIAGAADIWMLPGRLAFGEYSSGSDTQAFALCVIDPEDQGNALGMAASIAVILAKQPRLTRELRSALPVSECHGLGG
jgi:hypothetical protein